MPSMIETLIGEGVVRKDNKLIVAGQRPSPTRSRDLFGVLANLGQHATINTLLSGMDLRGSDPRVLFHSAFDRWPTPDELEDCSEDYDARRHVRSLILDGEFWQRLPRRICDAFPERPRLLFVRLPRCAGHHFLDTAGAANPVYPTALAGALRATRPQGRTEFVPILGTFLSRFGTTRSILLAQSTLAAFRKVSQPPPSTTSDLGWDLNIPPHRPGDRLFTIIREPKSLILSRVNALAATLSGASSGDDRDAASLRGSVATAALKNGGAELARAILAILPDTNPICNLLGDGTAAGTIRICNTANIEITDLEHYPMWIRYTWDSEPAPPTHSAPVSLTLADLSPEEQTKLASSVAEDSAFYAHVAPFIAASPNAAAKGSTL